MRILMLALAAAAAWAQPAARYDVILSGARVVDPKNNLDGRYDIGIRDGKIAAVERELRNATAERRLDVTGLLVTPGLVDMHVHAYHTTGVGDAWAGELSIAPDSFSFRTGVTAMADAGSAGWGNFEHFRLSVMERVKTRMFAFINIARLGMMTLAAEQYEADFNPAAVARLAAKHKDVVVGVKTAHWEEPTWTAVERALEAGRAAGIPIMVDFGYFKKERPYFELVGTRLRAGDISTHAYRSGVPFVDEQGKLYAYLSEARARGVIFDVGHGGGSLVFRNAVPAVAQRFYPDSISTDLHNGSMNAAMMDMPTVMAKFLAMGMPRVEVIRASTWRPAQILRHEEVGHLTVGAEADVAAWRIVEGSFAFADTSGGRITGRQRLQCELTLRAGKVVWDYNARAAEDYRTLGDAYGVREGEFIVPPKKK